MLTILAVFYEVASTVYVAEETLVKNDMAKRKRDYTEEEFLHILQERVSKKPSRA